MRAQPVNVNNELLLPVESSHGFAGQSSYVWRSSLKNHDVAVKRFREDCSRDQRYHELRLLCQLDQKNIVLLEAAGPDFASGSLDFLVMEYASCGDLHSGTLLIFMLHTSTCFFLLHFAQN